MSETVNFTINIKGNAYTGIAEIDKAMKTLSVTTKENLKLFDKLNQVSFKLNNINQAAQNLANTINNTIQPGSISWMWNRAMEFQYDDDLNALP